MPRAQIGGELSINSRAAQRALQDFQRHVQTTAQRVNAVKMKFGFNDAEARRALQHLDKMTGTGVTGKFTEMNSKLQLIGAGLRVAGQGMGSLIRAGTNFEGLVRALDASADGTERLEDTVQDLIKVAALPGLNFEIAARGAIKLQSLGYSAKEARDFIANLGNEVARTGGTVENMDGFIVQMAQTLSKGKVEMQDFKIMSEHITGFMKTAKGLDRTNATEFFDGLLMRLREMPRVLAGTQESFNNLQDEWKLLQGRSKIGNVVTGVSSAFADAATGMIRGQSFSSIMDNLGTELKDSFRGTGKKKGAIEKYERSPEQLAAQREIEKKREAAEAARIEQLAKDEQRKAEDIATVESDLIEARDAGDKKKIAALEDQLQIMKEAADIAEKLGVSEERAAKMIQEQNAHARHLTELRDRSTNKKLQQEERDRIKIEGLRASGRDKTADKMEREIAINEETKRFKRMGMTDSEARSLAEEQQGNQDAAAHFAKTGRRKIRGVKSRNRATGLDGEFHSSAFNFAAFQDEGIPGFHANFGPGSNKKQQAAAKKAKEKDGPPQWVDSLIQTIKRTPEILERISSQLLKNPPAAPAT